MNTKIMFPSMVNYYRKLHNLTMEELAEKVNKTKSTISKWESGQRSPKIYEIEEIAQLFGVDPHIMMFGFDYKSNNETISKTIDIMDELKENRQEKVLIYSKKQLEEQQNENIIQLRERVYNYYDNPMSAGTGEYLTDGVQETITLPVDYDADFVAPVSGDSMEPEYHNYDYVFVETTYDLSDGDIGVFILDGDAYIKELHIDDEGAFLHSLNPNYRDKPILPESDFRIVGKVVGRYNENDEKEN